MRKRREIELWAEDSDLPPEKLGVRLWRGFCHHAQPIADSIPNHILRANNGVQQILDIFDENYKGFVLIQQEDDFEQALYDFKRPESMNFISYTAEKSTKLKKYEAQISMTLPTSTKGKIMLRHASLDKSQAEKMQTWLRGVRTLDAVTANLNRLDTDGDITAKMAGGALPKKNYAGDFDGMDYPTFTTESGAPAPPISPAPTATMVTSNHGDFEGFFDHNLNCYFESTEEMELANFYADPQYDVGIDSEDEDCVHVFAKDLEDVEGFCEPEIAQDLAQFAKVHARKAELKKSRGFFTPSSSSPSGKGRGFSRQGGKGKGKGKFSDYNPFRNARDSRRATSGIVKTSISQISGRTRCWSCRGLGHVSKNCPNKGSGGYSAPSGPRVTPRDSSSPSSNLYGNEVRATIIPEEELVHLATA